MIHPKLIRITTVPCSLRTLLHGQHRFMSEQGFEVVGVSSPGKALEEVKKNEGIRTVPIKMTRTISPLRDLKSLWLFYRLCRREKPAIVHSHSPKAGIVGMMGAWLARVPIRIHTVAGLPLVEASGIKRKLLDMVEKLTYAFATKVYPNSHKQHDFIVENKYAKKEKLHVIANGSSNGIDTSFFSPDTVTEETKQKLRQELGIEADDFVFIFVGRMVGDKGLNELVEAFDTLVETYGRTPNAHHTPTAPRLLLVGNFERDLDPLLPQTEEIINAHPNIHAVGYRKNVKDYFAISDALVFPSYREGFPNVVMQAGAMGLPGIVSNINGCNEIIEEGANGTIIPVKDSNAIRQAMTKLIETPDYYNHLKQNARRMITERYEQRVVWEALLEEYRRLLRQSIKP